MKKGKTKTMAETMETIEKPTMLIEKPTMLEKMKCACKTAFDSIREFFSVIFFLYESSFDWAGLNSPSMRDSVFGYSLCAIGMVFSVTLLIVLCIGMMLLAVALVVGGCIICFKWLWPLYILFAVVCFIRWLYLRKHKDSLDLLAQAQS